MINLLIFSIIVGVVFSLVIVPFILSTQAKRGTDEEKATVKFLSIEERRLLL